LATSCPTIPPKIDAIGASTERAVRASFFTSASSICPRHSRSAGARHTDNRGAAQRAGVLSGTALPRPRCPCASWPRVSASPPHQQLQRRAPEAMRHVSRATLRPGSVRGCGANLRKSAVRLAIVVQREERKVQELGAAELVEVRYPAVACAPPGPHTTGAQMVPAFSRPLESLEASALATKRKARASIVRCQGRSWPACPSGQGETHPRGRGRNPGSLRTRIAGGNRECAGAWPPGQCRTC
jgi:hypothetical protein